MTFCIRVTLRFKSYALEVEDIYASLCELELNDFSL